MDRDHLQNTNPSDQQGVFETLASRNPGAPTQADSQRTQRPISLEPEEIVTFDSSGAELPRSQRRRLTGPVSDRQTVSTSFEPPLPPVPQGAAPHDDLDNVLERIDPRRRTLSVHRSSLLPQSEIDWIVPRSEQDKGPHRRTVGERLDPTLLTAIREKENYAWKAKITGYSLNVAIGLQILLGSLTTGLSVVTSGRQAQVVTAVLGGLATVVASYLARARGTREPELSISRVKDLEQFIRECEAFKIDYGHIVDDQYDENLRRLREKFEELLGNGNGDRKLSQPV